MLSLILSCAEVVTEKEDKAITLNKTAIFFFISSILTNRISCLTGIPVDRFLLNL